MSDARTEAAMRAIGEHLHCDDHLTSARSLAEAALKAADEIERSRGLEDQLAAKIASVRSKFNLPPHSEVRDDYWRGYVACLDDVERFGAARGSSVRTQEDAK